MPLDRVRHLRQLLLVGWGEAGQARIAAAVAAVGAGAPLNDVPHAARHELALGHEVAEIYARRAGFAAVTAGTFDCAVLAPPAFVTRSGPRAVLAGARAALAAMRAALAADPEDAGALAPSVP